MLKVRKLTVGEMGENCYLIWELESKEALILDPGDEADYIERTIADSSLRPIFCVATHGHFDHILAATEIKLAYRIPFCMSRRDSFLLGKVKHYSALPPKIDQNLEEGDKIGLGELKIKVLAVPGHTPGSLALRCPGHVFVGDTLFAGGAVGRNDFPYSDKEELVRSVARLRKLPKGTIVHPGHGEEFVIR